MLHPKPQDLRSNTHWEISMDIGQPQIKTIAGKTWATMDRNAKAMFLIKVAIMLCSFGFIFGGALVDGMVYEKLTDLGQ